MPGIRQWQWHLDEMYLRVNGEKRCFWRAVDYKGEVLESFVTTDRDKAAALTFMKKAMKRYGSPDAITTDGLLSYKAAMRELGNADKQHIGRWANNGSRTAICRNHFNTERHLVDRLTWKFLRSAALSEWRSLMA